MTFEEKQEEYAHMIVKTGAGTRKGRRTHRTCPAEGYGFSRKVAETAYRKGEEVKVLENGTRAFG